MAGCSIAPPKPKQVAHKKDFQMKFSRRIGALAVCAVALVSIAAQAAGIDVSGFVAAHRELFAGMSMLAMAGEIDDQRAIKAALDKISDSVKGSIGPLKSSVEDIQARLLEVEQKAVRGSGGGGDSLQLKVSGIVEDAGFAKFRAQSLKSTERYNLEMGVKALTNPSSFDSNHTVFPTQPDRGRTQYVPALRPLRLLDLMPSIPVTSNKYEFVQLRSTGGADVQAEEGDEKAAMNFDGELVDTPIATIAVHTTASLQVLDDADSLQSVLDRIMRHKALDKLESNMILGSGTGGNMQGLYTGAVAIVTQENILADRIGEAIYKMDNAGYPVSVILMNPADWFAISIMKDADGNYIYGNPANPAQPSLWNRPVITSPTIPLGTALVGDTNATNFLDRMQPTVYMTRDHKDYATRNLVLILVELRAGVALYDTAAFRRVSLAPQT
jgi:HK97 family phage major capsid protein